jgi:uncharacterized DUF497 family protein
MRFEWDEEKARVNVRKHGVYFETAAEVFEDPFVTAEGYSVVEGEVRAVNIGATRDLTLLYVVFTYRDDEGEPIIRIISARRVTRYERRVYEAHR